MLNILVKRLAQLLMVRTADTEDAILAANTILYCESFTACYGFYATLAGAPINTRDSWFAEFQVCPGANISIADYRRTSILPSGGNGITLTFQVVNLERWHKSLTLRGLNPGDIVAHPWGAHCFYLRDPESRRLEFWCSVGD